MDQANQSRRSFIKKMVYMPPAIATLTVLPAFHASGSGFTQSGNGVQANNSVSNGVNPQQSAGNPRPKSAAGSRPVKIAKREKAKRKFDAKSHKRSGSTLA